MTDAPTPNAAPEVTVALPEAYEDIEAFLASEHTPEVAARLQNFIKYVDTKTRLLLKPLQTGDNVEVLKDGNWIAGQVSSKSHTGLVDVETERGPVSVYEQKSRVRLPTS